MEYWQVLRSALGNRKLILPAAVGAVFDRGEVLLVRPAYHNAWVMPGGLQDLGESVTRTVEREIREELSLDVSVDHLVSIFTDPKWDFTFPNGDQLQQFTLFFRMKGKIDRARIRVDHSEIAEYGFFDPACLPNDADETCKIMCDDLRRSDGRVGLH